MMEWKEVRLGDIYDVHNGLSKGGKFFGSGFPFLTFSVVFNNYFVPEELSSLVQSTEKERLSCSIKAGDVFITRTSETAEELGMSCVALKDYPNATYNGFTKRLRKKDDCQYEVDSRYIGYYLRSRKFRSLFMGLSGSMSTRASLANGDLLNMPVSLPSLSNQRRIASILSSLDKKIETNNKINANLEEMAQAIFKNWFVDFAPFKDGKFVESELGMIPEGWRVVPFTDILTASTEKVGRDGVPEFSVTNTGIHPRDEKFNKNLSKSSAKNKILRKDNLVFGMSREILNWGIMKEEEGGVSSAYNIFIVDTNAVNIVYLENFIQAKMDYFHDLIKPASREGQGLDKTALFSKYIYVPTNDITESFLNTYTAIYNKMKSLEEENQRLASIRDTLLPRLMSGEIEV